jgi:hypothetical protein
LELERRHMAETKEGWPGWYWRFCVRCSVVILFAWDWPRYKWRGDEEAMDILKQVSRSVFRSGYTGLEGESSHV